MAAMIHDPLKCGQCGGEPHRLTNVRRPDDGRDHFERLHVTCLGCGNVSIISIKATIALVAHPKSDGTLCGGWG